MDLSTLRDRDAWATIRGFVYQVDITIMRWLDLEPNEMLELERGEDIDIVEGQVRSLEQIKVRQKKLTLRSKEANEAMASFHEHRNLNPNLKLNFRFITNAENGKENSPWNMNEKAIVVWNNIRQKKLSNEQQTNAIKNIRQFLLAMTRPKNFNNDTWKNWRSFLSGASDNDIYNYICSFEWGLHNPDPADIKEIIEQKLVEQRHILNFEEGNRLYESLFCYIFRLLTRKGIKSITKDSLTEVLSDFQITDIEKSILQSIDSLRSNVALHESRLEAVEKKLSQGSQGIINPLIWNVPHRPNPYFIERDDIVISLREILLSDQLTAVTQTIAGLGGIGKTQLVVHYAYKYRKDYDLIWWIDSEQEETIRAGLLQLALKLNNNTGSEVDSIDFVKEWLSKREKWLLIFDNANDINDIEKYFPNPQEGHILITSRKQDWPHEPIVLSEFNRSESIKFLMQRTNCTDSQQEPFAAKLAFELGYLPLALEHAGAYIKKKHKTFKEYHELYDMKKMNLLALEGIPNSYHSTILTTWTISIESIKQESNIATEWLNMFAYLGADQIPYAWFYDINNDNSKDILEKDQAIEVLSKYSLVNFNVEERHASLHRLVQEVIRNQMGDKEEEVLKLSVHVVAKDLSFDQYNYSSWGECKKLLSHAINVMQHIKGSPINNGNVISILLNLGLYFNHYTNYSTAKEYLLIAKEYCESRSSSTKWISSILNALFVTSYNLNEVDDAKDYIESALLMTSGIDAKRAVTLNNSAVQIMNGEGDFEKALTQFDEALEIEHLLYQSDNSHTAVTRNNIAECLAKMGRYPEAKVQHEITIKIERMIAEHSQELNPNLATRLSNYGGTLVKMGQPEVSLQYYEEALNILSEAFSGDDYRKAFVMFEYGGALLKLEKIQDAYEQINNSYIMLLNTDRKDDPQTKEIYLSRSLILNLLNLKNKPRRSYR
ncbi:FxSxx-COOH system tetratricopeptide repeat protein [Paenibacillus sp. MCAF9]|uniref:FxSxx-COOH system tetratricopeptide repeat protein n=1 Tax=Paenibacillus sp. MCAF9 TaxID=3233046 RepID=UPI003F9D0863